MNSVIESYILANQEVILGIMDKCLAILNYEYTLQSGSLPQIVTVLNACIKILSFISEEPVGIEKSDELTASLMEMAQSLSTSSKEVQTVPEFSEDLSC